MADEIGIIDLLKVFGFDASLKTKLVRHQDDRYNVPEMIRSGWFETYQSLQARPIFRECMQIVSFVGDGAGRAKFVGVYRVLAENPLSVRSVPENCPHQIWATETRYQYELIRCPEYADIEGRVVIDWGLSGLAYHQHLRNKPVIEMFPKGRVLEPFTDYLDFSLDYRELVDLVTNATAHRDWVSSLSAVAGVYLVLAQPTGKQYVGSAYGTEGIWGRWCDYASNGHGGNVKLRQLVESGNEYPDAFRYSILQVLPKSTSSTEVIRWESRYKKKLGSRATGLN